ncbi:MAG: hypothetical protein FWG32_09835, partial [Oscillospiraceae bacterium]|nr:hypothetical protein [Oscillospiraceae bacterium]
MKSSDGYRSKGLGGLLNRINLNLRPKLILIFLAVMVIPIILLTFIASNQIGSLGHALRDIAVTDSVNALNDGSRENIERMTTDTAASVARFLYQRDDDIRTLSGLLSAFLSDTEIPDEASDTLNEVLCSFTENNTGRLMKPGEWILSDDKMSWIEKYPVTGEEAPSVSANKENNDVLHGSSFSYRPQEHFATHYESAPLYDEVSFIDLNGNEIYKYVTPNSTKKNYPLNPDRTDVSGKSNTYIKAESYFERLKSLKPGEIYVSDVIGAYVGTNYIGMYTPGVLSAAVPQSHPNYALLSEIALLPDDEFIKEAEKQAFAGKENPVGRRFEGIVRWAMPVMSAGGTIVGYVTMALNHDHIMEFVDHITPMNERYTELPSANEGNYAFIWDYECRSICHPRHHSIVGYNPLTGEPQVPWLEGSFDYERDYANGGFRKLPDENGNLTVKVPVTDSEGNAVLAADTPFYFWYTNGGEEWLAANPSWDNLSAGAAGVSWGEFLKEYSEDREILPQFGERLLKTGDGNPVKDAKGNYIKDYQSRDKTPAAALTGAGFVGLDGRYLN